MLYFINKCQNNGCFYVSIDTKYPIFTFKKCHDFFSENQCWVYGWEGDSVSAVNIQHIEASGRKELKRGPDAVDPLESEAAGIYIFPG